MKLSTHFHLAELEFSQTATWRVIVRSRPELDAMAADWRVKLGL